MQTPIILKPHQRTVFNWAKTRSRIALFLEMRVGKTYVTMKWVEHHKLQRVLLIAPWDVLVGSRNWQGALTKTGREVTMLCLLPTDQREAAAQYRWHARSESSGLLRRPATGWHLLHYEGLRVAPEVLDLHWDAIIVDESTKIRNPQAQVTKLLTGAKAEYRAILSGLPNPEDALDFFSQFKFLLGHCLGFDNFWAFRESKFTQGGLQWQWFPKTGTLPALKKFVHTHSYFLTRKTAGIGSVKIPEQRSVPMAPKQEAALKVIAHNYAYDGVETKWAPVVHTWVQRIAGGFDPLDDTKLLSDWKPKLLLNELTDEFAKESVVVWFRFNHEIDYCYELLRRKKVSVERVHGALKMPRTERAKIQDRFQDGKTRIILLQLSLGKFGWDLSRANTAMYYSNSYEYELRAQSEDRIIHLSKTVPCRIIDLVTVGSSDEDIVDAMDDKKFDAKKYSSVLMATVAKQMMRFRSVHPGDRL